MLSWWHYTVSRWQCKVSGVTTAENSTDLTADELETLLKDPKSTTEFRILRATRRLLAREGLGVSVDAVAVEAELGRRTIFRHFATRDDLIARALSDSLGRFHSQVADAISESSDIDEWLVDVVTQLHGSQRRAGMALWQLSASNDDDLSPPIARVNKHRRESRQVLTNSIADTAWKKAGGNGTAPRSVELAVALSISSFAVHSLNVDYGAGDDETVASVAAMLSAILKKELSRK